MKNVVFGMVGMMIIIYTFAISLGVYNTYVRKNELDNSLSHVMKSVMQKYYVPDNVETEMKKKDLEARNQWAENEVINEMNMRMAAGEKTDPALGEAGGLARIDEEGTEAEGTPGSGGGTAEGEGGTEAEGGMKTHMDREGLEVKVTACDMDKGILGVEVIKRYIQINGKQREIHLERVLIAE